MKTLKLLVAVIASIITTSLHAQVPQILSQPSSQTVGVGSNFTVNVTATGSGILYYWYKGASLLTNGTDSFYSVSAAALSDAGNYQVVVTNSSGAVTSSVAVISVLAQPAITVQPVSSNAATNTNVVLSVTATGGGSLAYQWYKDGTTISGATSSSYTVSGTSQSYGVYTVTVTNAVGSVTSSGATVYIVGLPVTASSPTNKTVAVGASASFSVTCSNAATSLLSYQWSTGSTNIPNATNTTLSLSGLTTNDSGTYTVTISNLAGVITKSATLTVLTPVAITTSPLGTNVAIGTNVVLSVAATGDSIGYQWRKGGVAISGATSASYTNVGSVVADSGTYSVLVSNAVSSVTSAGVTVLVVAPPVIATQPADKTLAVGGTYTLSVVCSNAATSLLNYQWRKDSVDISGATNATYVLTSATTDMTGYYNVYVTNLAGSALSATASVAVRVPITITTNISSTNVGVGTNVIFGVTVAGDNPVYQWRKGSTNIPGATSSGYGITGAALTDSGTYSVLVTNAVSSVASSNAVVTVVALPGISAQPASKGVALGGTVTLSVTVSNSALVSYAWYHGSDAVTNATTNSLKLTGITTNDAGNYFVVVSNLVGAVTSSVATVTILYTPTITTDLTDTNVPVGTNFTLTVGASGGLLSYAWYNGTNVLYSTNSSVTVTNPQTTDSGSYFVVVTNAVGAVTSSVSDVLVVAPPSIVIQPKSKALVTGTNYNLYIVMQNPDTSLLNYQWYFNGSALDGEISSNLNLTSVTADLSGSYTVVVTNIAGVVTSSVATILVQSAPVITTQPASTNLVATTGNLVLTVGTTGDTLTYQWYKGGVAISGATSATYSVTGAATSDSGVYYVVVTNSVAKVTSANATVYVVAAPSITTQPTGGSVVVGSDFVFSVTAANASTSLLSYQWLFNGAPIDGATASTLYLAGVGANDAGSYSVIVSNIAGSVTSSTATLVVQTMPTIVTQPANTNLATNSNFTLTVEATGGQLKYQWYRVKTTSTNIITGQTNSTYTVTNAQVTNSGTYYVVISNAMGSVASDKAVVTVVAAPVIVTQPVSTNVVEWSDVTFSVVCTNASISLLHYQWYFDGLVIDQATNSSLTLTEVFNDIQGDYSVVVTNLAGSVTSSVATLNIATPVSVIAGPVNTNLAVGGTINLSIYATGNLLQYQWAKNFTNIPGATSSNLVINSAVVTNSGIYTVTVTNIAGAYAVTSAVVTVVAQPVILTNPVSRNIGEGDDVTFSVVVSNAANSLLNYQWYFGSNQVANATNKDLTLQYVTTDRAGDYSVVVTNLAGAVTSTVATLIVQTFPTITAQPTNLDMGSGTGSNFTLSVTATGGLLQYQWYKNSSNISGATSSSYTVSNATTNDSGTYTVIITNGVGAVTSSNAVIRVVNAPNILTNITDQLIADGDVITFAVTLADASSSLLSYQWYFNTNTVIDGATTDTLEFVVGSSDAGKYSVVITNVAGVVTSTIADLTVLAPVAVTTQPLATNVGVGTNVNLNVDASGGGTLGFQWYKDGVAISGATASNFTFSAATSTYGLYYALVTNEVSEATSDSVAVRIVGLPVISTNLSTNTYVISGTSYTMSVALSNPNDLITYQWLTNDVVLAGATSATLTLNSLATNDSPLRCYVLVSNIAGTLFSFTNTLNIEQVPSIASDLYASTNIAKGGDLNLSIGANGSALGYQWYRGTHGVGLNSSNLVVTNASVTDSGAYSVVVTNDVGAATSSVAQVLVVATPVIMTPPAGGAILVTSNFTFSVVMRSATNSLLTYQWLYGTNAASATNAVADGTSGAATIAGATTSTLSITSADTNITGFYSVWVTNLAGMATSTPVQLKVQHVPTISGQPSDTNVAATSNIVLTVTADGDYIGFIWRKGSNVLSAPSTNVFTLTNAAISDSGSYSVIVTNAVGSITSSVAAVKVVAPPVITTQPINKAVPVGSNFTFNVVVSNAASSLLTYQWYFGNDTATNAVSGGTGSSLALTGLTTNETGVYFVVVTNIAGSVTSSVVTLKVQTRPAITVQPTDVVVGISNALNLSVTATGEGIGYQWRKGGANILNATASNYVNSSALVADAGTYSVFITNGVGSVLSSNAVVKVVTPPVITKQPTSRSIITGTTTTLSVTVSNAIAQVVSYQWQKDGTNISATATNNSYQLVNVTNTDSGDYTVIVHNAASDVTSAVATVLVQTRPTITVQPQSSTIGVGTNLVLSVTATGDGIGYQWRMNGTNLPTGIFSTYTVTGATTNDSGVYSVVVSNAVGLVTSSNARAWVVQAPSIATQPVSNVVVAVGSNYTFSVIASNASTSLLSYQWLKDGTNIFEAVTNKLLLKKLTIDDSGTYSVIITNLAGSVTSTPAVLLALDKPNITNSPYSTNVGAGQPVTLTVEASGGLLNYQWRKGTAALAGQTNNTFTIASVQSSNAGAYNVVVTNQVGKVISSNATVTVIGFPAFAKQPSNANVAIGSNAVFSVTVSNASTSYLSYNWYSITNGTDTNLLTSITNSLVVTNVTTNHAGSYWVVVSNMAGMATSTVVTLTPLDIPVITTNPVSTNVPLGSNIVLSVTATGSNLKYSWALAGKAITGQTNTTLTITNAASRNAGTYTVVVTNAIGKATSSNAIVKVIAPPGISKQPVGGSVVNGTNYTFSVTMSNAAASMLSYQWYKDSVAITNATTNTFKLTGVSTNDEGTYYVVVTNIAGTVTSTNASLVVQVKPAITAHPQGTNIGVGTNITLSATATGTGISYVWKLGSKVIAGATNDTLTVTGAAISNAGIYTITVSNKVGKVVSSNAVVTVVAAPGIAKQPVGKSLITGATYTLSVTASNASTSRIRYQWQKDGSDITGATTNVYKITSATTNDSATYSVILTNEAGTITSTNAVILVQDKPAISAHPASTNLAVSNTLTLSVTASGTDLKYIWRQGTNILTAFNDTNTLVITNAVVTNSGTYSVIVSNSVGKVISSNAVVRVVDIPVITNQPTGGAVGLGSNYTFTVKVATNSLLNYRWTLNGLPIDTGTTNTFKVSGASYDDAGDYAVIVTNLAGAVTSSVATLVVQAKPVITTQPASKTVLKTGSDFALSVAATGDSLFYQWRVRHGSTTTNILNATNSTLSLSSIATNDAGVYSVVVSNLVGSATSGNAILTVLFLRGTNWVEKASGTDGDTSEYAAAAGSYNGLFAGTEVLDKSSAGFYSVSLTPNLTYSGKILIDGETVVVSGVADQNGKASATFTRANGKVLKVDWSIDLANRQLTGSVSSDSWKSSLTADLAQAKAEAVGTYKVSFPTLGIDGAVAVSANGSLVFVGTTVDGLALTQSTQISGNGYWPLFVLIDSGASGEIIGWVEFVNGAPTGEVTWLQPQGGSSNSKVTVKP